MSCLVLLTRPDPKPESQGRLNQSPRGQSSHGQVNQLVLVLGQRFHLRGHVGTVPQQMSAADACWEILSEIPSHLERQVWDSRTVEQRTNRWRTEDGGKFPTGPQKYSNVALLEGERSKTCCFICSFICSLISPTCFFLWIQLKFWTQPEDSTTTQRRQHTEPWKRARRADHSWYP